MNFWLLILCWNLQLSCQKCQRKRRVLRFRKTPLPAPSDLCLLFFREELDACHSHIDSLTNQQRVVESEIEREKEAGNRYVAVPACHRLLPFSVFTWLILNFDYSLWSLAVAGSAWKSPSATSPDSLCWMVLNESVIKMFDKHKCSYLWGPQCAVGNINLLLCAGKQMEHFASSLLMPSLCMSHTVHTQWVPATQQS